MIRTFLFCFFFLSFGWAQEEAPTFLDGVSAYKAKDFKKAQEIFSPLVLENPENPVLLYNLGLAEYQLGRFGMALGLWRKARFIDDDLPAVEKAIEFTEEQLFPDQQGGSFIVTIYEGLKKFPLWAWCGLSLMSFFLFFFFSLEYGVKKRLPINLWPAWLFAVFPIFLFTSFFAANIFLQQKRKMGTVITKQLQTHVNPSETSPTLSELDEGQVIYVDKIHGQWLQIRTLTGSPGWVPQNSIIVFRGR